jgi:hypothetical protein
MIIEQPFDQKAVFVKLMCRLLLRQTLSKRRSRAQLALDRVVSFLASRFFRGAAALTPQTDILIVPPPHHQEIYLDREYPCPCHLKGQLQQIVLTEAFGCVRCQKIFVLPSGEPICQGSGYVIEELAAIYPYKRRYYWNGTRWQIFRQIRLSPWFWSLLAPSRSTISWGSWILPLRCLGLIALLAIGFRLYCRLVITCLSPDLGLLMAIAIVVLIFTMLWLFSQGS